MIYLRTNLRNPSSIHIMITQMILLLLCCGISLAAGTTTSDGGFPDCNFEVDICGWNIEHDSDFSWIRTTPQEQIDAGHNCIDSDPNGNADGGIIYVQSLPGMAGDMARIQTPRNQMETKTCMMFEYSMDHVDGIRAMRILTQADDGWEEVVWDLPSSLERNAEWPEPGQVPLETHRVIIEAVRGDSQEGYAVMDDFFFFDAPDCPVLPPEAKPHPTEIPTVPTTTRKPDIGCSFDYDMCGYQITGDNGFKFSRKNGENFQNDPQHGPVMDENESTTAYFVHISASQVHALVKDDLAVSEIQIPTIQAMDHMIECFHFWFAMKRDGTIRTISIVQQDEEGENTNGAVKIIWNYHSSQVDNENWLEGQVEVRADAVEDVFRNYTLKIVAERHGISEDWAALDAFTFSRNDVCMMKPRGAEPASTTPLTPTTTTTKTTILPPSVCFKPGICLGSFMLEEIPADTANDCLESCKDNSMCQWFSFFPDVSACALFSNCEDLNVAECPTCLTGQKDCPPQLHCDIHAQCKGTFVHGEKTISSSDCLLECQARSSCEWFTWDSRDGACILLGDCVLSVDDDCQTCTSGQKECHV